MARHDEKTSVGRAKVLSGGDTGYRLAEVDEVRGLLRFDVMISCTRGWVTAVIIVVERTG